MTDGNKSRLFDATRPLWLNKFTPFRSSSALILQQSPYNYIQLNYYICPQSTTLLFPWVKQHFPNFALIKFLVALSSFIKPNNFIHQACLLPNTTEHVISLDKKVQCHGEHRTHWTSTEIERYVLCV